jgi:hypothetical protein
MFASKDVFLTPPATGGYTIARSVRLRNSASAYLNRTLTTPTSANTWTLSVWLKRGILGSSYQSLFGTIPSTGAVIYYAADSIVFWKAGAAVATSTAVYRDPSAWYHLVINSNGTTVTAYINNVSVLSYTGTLANINSANAHYIGTRGGLAEYFDGYLTEINFIDGQQLTPSSFGSTNSTTGVWQPAKYTGTYGTNGFYLNFSDNSAVTTSSNVGIGKDFSGNGNYCTSINISVTAGTTYDSMTDVPTLTSATAANYAVYNPLKLGSSGTWTVTDGNLAASNSGSNSYSIIASSIGVSSGKWYFEFTATNVGSGGNLDIGILQDGNSFGGSGGSASSIGQFATGYCYESNGTVYNNNTSGGSYSSFTTNDVVQMALDLDNNKIYFGKNGTWQNSGNPAAGTGQIYSVTAGTYFAAIGRASVSSQTGAATANFGQRPFTYTPPTGFVALNTYNLPAGTITTSGTFTGNASTDGPFVYLNGVPTAMTINGNAVTFGTNADHLANGFKVRSSSASYNASGSNTYTISTTGAKFKNAIAQTNP